MQPTIHSSPSSDSDFGALRQLIGEEAIRKIIGAYDLLGTRRRVV